jgi:hypothetical protein
MANGGWLMVRTRNKHERKITTSTIENRRDSKDLKLIDAVLIEPFMRDELSGFSGVYQDIDDRGNRVGSSNLAIRKTPHILASPLIV